MLFWGTEIVILGLNTPEEQDAADLGLKKQFLSLKIPLGEGDGDESPHFAAKPPILRQIPSF